MRTMAVHFAPDGQADPFYVLNASILTRWINTIWVSILEHVEPAISMDVEHPETS